jgi:uncharacterized membrane protein YccC
MQDMAPSRDSTPAGKVFEHSVLSTDAARAMRSSIALAAAWVACLVAGHPEAIIIAAPTAQNVAMLDVRGDYGVRVAILLTLTIVIAFSALLGTIAGNDIVSATLTIGLLAMLAGCWRHFSGDYGPNFALASGLLYFLALPQPGDWSYAWSMAAAALLAGLGAIVVQLSGWFVRPQHALRHAVAETWVAASDLITAMRTETDDGRPVPPALAEKEGALRATADRTFHVIATTASDPGGQFAKHLDDATHLAARCATRATAFHTALEPLRSRPGFSAVAPTLDSALRSLASALRSAALTLITHRPEQLLALEVRLTRAGDMLQVLDTRLAALEPPDAEITQARQLLAQVVELLPAMRATLGETVDHGAPDAGFALRLPELGGMSARSFGAWLNPPTQVDWSLVRYTFRVAVVLMLCVAVYKGFHMQRGHWIGLTALVVLQPDYGATRHKLAQRLFGTLAGVTLGSLLLWVKLPTTGFIIGAAVMAFCFAYFLRRRYGLAVFFVTLMIVLMIESVMPVHLDFTIERMLATLAGGGLALLAALVFWPRWEQSQSPGILAAALRANRTYLETVAAHYSGGERFTGDAILAKREAERANSLASASLQRWLGEPARRHHDLERIAALTTYNQRLTRAITVLGQQLNQCAGQTMAGARQITANIGSRMETLAMELESGHHARSSTFTDRKQENDPSTTANASPNDMLFHRQIAKVVTEIDAMKLAAAKNAAS